MTEHEWIEQIQLACTKMRQEQQRLRGALEAGAPILRPLATMEAGLKMLEAELRLMKEGVEI